MAISYYTIDDVNLGLGSLFRKGWKLRRFQTLEDALANYRALPSTCVKTLGMSNGTQVLGLVECLPMDPEGAEGEDVLSSDYTALPLWKDVPEAARATDLCVFVLNLRYLKDGNVLIQIPASRKLPESLEDKLLWLNVEADRLSAIRWAYVVGTGWVLPSVLKTPTSPRPVVTKYRADGVTGKGAYLTLELTPWEYNLLLRRTMERLEQNKNE